ncbi:MAG: tetratricopeptide repeat protein, partial [Bacteroidetes bacterium]|nr:tetratricopeptide repeat protein [Bacteroidota bacterium]
PDTLISINHMGVLLDVQGKLDEAEPYYREALEGRRRVLGDDHPSTLTSINNMGNLLNALGKYEDAASVHRRALDLRERHLGSHHPEVALSLTNLGNVLLSQGRLHEALQFHQRALSIHDMAVQRAVLAQHNIVNGWRRHGGGRIDNISIWKIRRSLSGQKRLRNNKPKTCKRNRKASDLIEIFHLLPFLLE